MKKKPTLPTKTASIAPPRKKEDAPRAAKAPKLELPVAGAEPVVKLKERLDAQKKPELHHAAAPAGYSLRGVSTLIGEDGNVKQFWVKTGRDQLNALAALEIFKQAVAEAPPPTRPLIEVPVEACDPELLAVYPMGDPHIGMLSWGEETGEDFDLRIAERTLLGAVDRLVRLAPSAHQGLVINLGDFFHSDNQDARTSRGKHQLDVDSRWGKVLRLGISIMVRVVDRVLEKHNVVRVISARGNHDDHTSQILQQALVHHYHANPRVEIDDSPSTFYWHEFGKCLIGVTHGHGPKPKDLPGIMANDKAEAWGRTLHRYWYTGHIHHETKKEIGGAIVESFRTLAAKDAWHHAQGYRAGRSMVCDVLHRDWGRITRHEIGVSALV